MCANEVIRPLEPKKSKSAGRGRPALWDESIPPEYVRLLNAGYAHSEILAGWKISETTFKSWIYRSDILKKAYESAPGVDLTAIKAEYTKEALRQLASEALQDLIASMRSRPSAYKPQEIITACREALDRTEGKAAQTIAVESRSTVTHEHILKLDPAEAYRRLIEDDVRVIDITPKKTPLPAPGGSAADWGPGVNEGEAPPDINNNPSPLLPIIEAPWK